MTAQKRQKQVVLHLVTYSLQSENKEIFNIVLQIPERQNIVAAVY